MTFAENLETTMKALLDAVYAAGKVAGGGGGNRREYNGTIESEVKGSSAYAVLAQDEFLADIRTLDTLFVRVEFAIDLKEPPAYTIVKTWASNVGGIVMPISANQQVHRSDVNGDPIFTNISKSLYDEPAAIGLVHITEDGELRLYSGSPNYAIRPCNFKVIVEW